MSATGFAVADKVVVGDRAGALEALRWAQLLGTPSVRIAEALADALRTLAKVGSAGRGARLAQRVDQSLVAGPARVHDHEHDALGRVGRLPDDRRGQHPPYRVFGAQATGCSPVAKAFEDGHDVVQPVRPDTIARSLAIGNPADGPYVLDAVRRTGGALAPSATRRSSRASSCSPAPRACSPRPRAASPSPRPRS